MLNEFTSSNRLGILEKSNRKIFIFYKKNLLVDLKLLWHTTVDYRYHLLNVYIQMFKMTKYIIKPNLYFNSYETQKILNLNFLFTIRTNIILAHCERVEHPCFTGTTIYH